MVTWVIVTVGKWVTRVVCEVVNVVLDIVGFIVELILSIPIIGFDALPEALASVRDGGLAATIEQFPGGQSRGATQVLVDYLRANKKPEKVILLTPIAITKDNIDQAERLGEVK